MAAVTPNTQIAAMTASRRTPFGSREPPRSIARTSITSFSTDPFDRPGTPSEPATDPADPDAAPLGAIGPAGSTLGPAVVVPAAPGSATTEPPTAGPAVPVGLGVATVIGSSTGSSGLADGAGSSGAWPTASTVTTA